MVLTNREIAARFNAMEGSDKDKLEVLASITQIPKKTIREIIEHQNGKVVEDVTVESAADLAFESGTAIYKLVVERLDTLDRIIKNCTKEYEELSRYLKNGNA